MPTPHITIITPCYNENVITIRFLECLEKCIDTLPYNFTVLVVNDCSTDNTALLLARFKFHSPSIQLKVINLKFNVGHQAAIYQGFLYAHTLDCNHFIVMDSDGEDAPDTIIRLLEHLDTDIVNVVRSERRESPLFKIFYWLYKFVFRLITRKRMNFGNFCLINRSVMETAIYSTFSHFAAFLSKQKAPTKYIIAKREERLGGKSKMGFRKLFIHAFMSFVEYGEDMLLVFFKGFIFIILVLGLSVGYALYQKLVTHAAIPGWASIAILGMVNMAILCMGFFVLGLLLIHLNNQNPNTKIPIYDIETPEPDEK